MSPCAKPAQEIQQQYNLTQWFICLKNLKSDGDSRTRGLEKGREFQRDNNLIQGLIE